MKKRVELSAMTAALFLAVGVSGAYAQTASEASSQDKTFLHDLAQDSNFEIKSSQLALQKSSSPDIKQYARMIIHDHAELKQQIASADTAAKAGSVSAGSMSGENDATYAKLKLESGKNFDESYLKNMAGGNQDIEKMEQSEASDSAVPKVKALAQHAAETDKKHEDKAKALAQTHHINVNS